VRAGAAKADTMSSGADKVNKSSLCEIAKRSLSTPLFAAQLGDTYAGLPSLFLFNMLPVLAFCLLFLLVWTFFGGLRKVFCLHFYLIAFFIFISCLSEFKFKLLKFARCLPIQIFPVEF
jgi:hypothetical protein